MAIGISTSCFYPETTEKSLERVCKCGAEVTEIFINSPSELDSNFVDYLNSIRNAYCVKVKSLHTCGSFAESYFYFSEYERRFYDSLDDFKRYFYAARTLGADFIVIHGFRSAQTLEDKKFFERYAIMSDLAKEAEITLTQENVVNYRSGSPDFLCRMRDALQEKFKMTLDIKQARRSGFSPYDFTDKLSDSIVHIHISDYSDENDCVTPMTDGKFNFSKFFSVMKEKGYDGDYIIELYRKNFESENDLKLSKERLSKIL